MAAPWSYFDQAPGNILILFCGVIYCKLNIKWWGQNMILTNLHMVDIPYARKVSCARESKVIKFQLLSSSFFSFPLRFSSLHLFPFLLAHAFDAFPHFLSIFGTPGLVVLLLHLGGILGLPLCPRHWCSGLFSHFRSTDFNPAATFFLMTLKKWKWK